MLNKIINSNNSKPYKVKLSDSFIYYREKFKKSSRRLKITNKQEYMSVVRECLRLIKFYWLNATGGVYIKGLGYFTFYMPQRRIWTKNFDILSELKGKGYLPILESDLRRADMMEGFVLKMPTDSLMENAIKSIKMGRRYTNHTKIIQEYIKKKRNLD